MPVPYDTISYPSALDFFYEVKDGTSPENLVLAKYVNKIQNAIVAAERNTQYSATTPSLTGHLMYMMRKQVKLTIDDEYITSIIFSIDPTISTTYFGGNPFSRDYCIFSSAVGYKIVNGARSYLATRTGVNAKAERSNLTCIVNVFTPNKWHVNNIVEATLTIVRP